jgi:hypothetical protein
MLSQYVFPSKQGLFRVVRHGHRWRGLLDAREIGRYDSIETAIFELRSFFPQARLPEDLRQWRHLPQLALVHSRASNEQVLRWRLMG